MVSDKYWKKAPMSIIVAKSTTCSSSSGASVAYSCYPAIAQVVPVTSGGTVIADSIATSLFRGAKWDIVTVANDGRTRSFEVFAGHRGGTSPAHVAYSFLGDQLSITANVTTSGGVMVLSITNTSSVDVVVYATRKAIPMGTISTVPTNVIEIASINGYLRPNQQSTYDFLDDQYVGCKWIINATDGLGHTVTTQVFAQLAGTVRANEYGRLGDYALPFDVIVTEIPSVGVELSIRNETTAGYKIHVTRIPIPKPQVQVSHCGPSRGLSLWAPTSTIIPANATSVIDTVNTAHVTVKWLIGVYNPLNQQTMLFETIAVDNQNTTFAVIGDYLAVNPTVAMSAGQQTISLTNPLPTPIHVNALRVPVAS